MIKQTHNINDIALVWGEAFGDSFDDIKYFEENVQNAKCLAYYDNESICSLLYLVDCTLCGEHQKYVYAVCTLKKYKAKGFATELIEYAKKEYGSLCLIPANKSLIDFYKKRGFTNKYEVNDIEFFESDELKNDYLLVGCELEKPIILSDTEV